MKSERSIKDWCWFVAADQPKHTPIEGEEFCTFGSNCNLQKIWAYSSLILKLLNIKPFIIRNDDIFIYFN